jgi:hypothetical protein
VLRIDVESWARYDNDVTDFYQPQSKAPTSPVPVVSSARFNAVANLVAVKEHGKFVSHWHREMPT